LTIFLKKFFDLVLYDDSQVLFESRVMKLRARTLARKKGAEIGTKALFHGRTGVYAHRQGGVSAAERRPAV